MPTIKIDHIVSFSSEDSAFPANNLLHPDPAKKWKCQNPGEKNATMVLQLEKACVITNVDIGNEHSAYVEVLVSRSSSSDPSDYKVLLVMSAFMTATECRQSENINKVRMFGRDDLAKPECNEKWDRVKIVCTQPFNRRVKYGLSFINLHTNTNSDKPTQNRASNIEMFTLRPDSPVNLTAGSLFARRKEPKQEAEPLKGAAAIREASTSLNLFQYASPGCSAKLKQKASLTPKHNGNSSVVIDVDKEKASPKPRNRNEILYRQDEEDPSEKIDKLVEKKAKETKEKLDHIDNEKQKKKDLSRKKENDTKTPKQKTKQSLGSSSTNNDSSKSPAASSSNSKRKLTPEINSTKRVKKSNPTKPFSQLLNGVTLVISGIQNPDRANLRTKALVLGAKYKPDWDGTCTHLICAFPNTPKFNQVRGKGTIVTKKWIEECYKERKRLPWRRFALDKNDIGVDESEDEIWEETVETVANNIDDNRSSDVESDVMSPLMQDDGFDTDEEIARIQRKTTQSRNPYTIDTDEETDVKPQSPPATSRESFPKTLRTFFEGKIFFIDHSFDEDVYDSLRKYIVAYKGELSDDPTDVVHIFVTNADNSETMKEINSNGLCLRPEWIWECHNAQKLVPDDEFVL